MDNLEHLLLDEFLLEHQSIFVPDEVRLLKVDIIFLHTALEQVDDVAIVWVLGEAETSAVVHKFLEFLRLVFAELLDLDLLLLFLDVGVLLSLGSSGEALPWESTLQEVEEHMPDCLQVISSRLLVSNMGVDGGVSCGTSEVLAVSERNVLTIRALVALGQSKIDNVDGVFGLLSASNQKVVGFDIPMNDSLFVHNFDSLDHLNGNVQNSIEVKLSSALLEQVFEGLTEHVHDHDVVHLTIFCLLVTDEM